MWELTKKQRKERRELAVAMLNGGYSIKEIQVKLGGNLSKAAIEGWKFDSLEAIRIEYKAVGYCSNKHKKSRKIAVCVIEGKNYCYICGCTILAKRGVARKLLKKAYNKKFKEKKNNNKLKSISKTKTKATWKKRVFASWKDTPEQAAIRRSPEYQEWRRIILERDNYTCQHCEETGGRLVVHHIKTFKMNPELRMEPDNGIVLCNKCHEVLHLSRMKKPRILRLA